MSSLKTGLLLLLLALPVFPGAPHEDPRALMFSARALQRRAGGDDPEGAAAIYRRIIALVPQSAEAHLRLSESLMEAGALDEAVAPALKATGLNPRSAEAWVHLGTLQFLRSQNTESARPECRKALQQASRLAPGDIEVLLRLAQICQALNDDEGSMNAWLRLGRIHPMGTFQDRPLAAQSWEKAAVLASTLNRYEAKREAIMALCRGNRPEARHLRLLEELAREQAEKGYLGHAEESFLLLAQNVPGEPGLWENIARIQIQTEHFEDALKSLENAETLKKYPRLTYFKAISLMNLGRFPEAEALWQAFFMHEESGEDKELQRNASFCYGVCLLLAGRPGELLDQLKAWPENEFQGDLQALKVQCLIQTRQWKASRLTLQTGIARFQKQSLFARAGKLIPADQLTERFWSLGGPRQKMVQLDLEAMAGLWAEFQQWDQCLAAILKARKASGNASAELLLLHANALDQLNRFAEATEVYREAQKLKPEDAMLQNNLGYLLLERGGDLEEASRLIAASLQQDPQNASTLDSWGWVQFKQGNYKEAEETLRKAVELKPYNPEIRKHLGEVLLKLERREEALEQWERALAYAFPDRKELEQRARKLRVDLAKQQQEAATEAAPMLAPPEDEFEVEDEE